MRPPTAAAASGRGPQQPDFIAVAVITRYARGRHKLESAKWADSAMIEASPEEHALSAPIIDPYLVEQERMANVQLLMYGSKQTDQNSSN